MPTIKTNEMQLSKCNRTKVGNEKARADNEKDKDGKIAKQTERVRGREIKRGRDR